MTKKATKKLLKAIKKGNCSKMAEICKKHSFGVEATEELMFRALYRCMGCEVH